MKYHSQFFLALFLILICSVSNQILRHNKINDSCVNKESFEVSLDIGVSEDSIWICSSEGNVMYNHNHKVHVYAPLTIVEKAAFKCSAVDVDYIGLPWAIDTDGNVQRLTSIALTSVKWIKTFEAKADNKAVDIGCGQQINSNCYISLQKGDILIFNGKNFIPTTFKSSKPLIALDVFPSIEGESIIGILSGDNKAVELRSNGSEKPLGIFANDISVSFLNHIYAANNFGIYIKTRCSIGFYKISDSIANKIGAGNIIWFIGLDKSIYKGKKLNSVKDCNN